MPREERKDQESKKMILPNSFPVCLQLKDTLSQIWLLFFLYSVTFNKSPFH